MTTEWVNIYKKDNRPTAADISDYIANPLWDDLNDFLRKNYDLTQGLFYSNCLMDGGAWAGWNVKYAKNSKTLCTLYPKQGSFLALVPVSNKDIDEAEMIINYLSEYTQNLWNSTKSGHYGKSLAFEVTCESILHDVKMLIQLRRKPKGVPQ